MTRLLLIFLSITLVLSLTAVIPSRHTTASEGDIYVDCNAPVGGNGSQASPYNKIQIGIDNADLGAIVYVAAGTYHENIILKRGVEVWGADTTTTIIDGMKNGSVVTSIKVDNWATFDGFTVTNGSGTYSSALGMVDGGGMYISESSLTISNCIFANNSADNGGGMLNYNSSPTIADCTFRYNSADNYGGGMYNEKSSPVIRNAAFENNSAHAGGGMMNNYSSPIITKCTFSNNSASYGDGGGMLNTYYSSPTLTVCTFQNNSAYNYGGGMCNYGSTAITKCTFLNNSAYIGGGMHNELSSTTITDCTFKDNLALDFGGGMDNYHSASPAITNCVFDNNTATTNGGGMHNYYSSPAITNCVFWNNSANSGSGIWNYASSPTITSCTFAANSATNGGGIYNSNSSAPAITNCILWNNSPDEVYNDGSSTPSITYCDVHGDYGIPSDNNINSDPMFADASTGDIHLISGSPCIDAGNNSAPCLPAIDFEGDHRILPLGGIVDMGADEYMPPTPSCDSWNIKYKIVGGQVIMNYSLTGMTPTQKVMPLSEELGWNMTIEFCWTVNNGKQVVVIPHDSWHADTMFIADVFPGVNMNLSLNLSADAVGVLYVQNGIGDVDINSKSVAGRVPVQQDTVGNGVKDAAGSMMIDTAIMGSADTSVGISVQLPFDMIFTTGHSHNQVIEPGSAMNGSEVASDGIVFAQNGGIAPYVGTNGTITATGTGDCLGLNLLGIPVDFQCELKLEIAPVSTPIRGDLNSDGACNILDIVSICDHWEETGTPCWIIEDLNCDGEINILDVIITCDNWTF